MQKHPLIQYPWGGYTILRASLLVSRPFHVDEDGFVMEEGICILILEELEHAKVMG